ncbi:efflux RND transporter periplasmic adaptor subunit [bacterium]|nr:efflux RND transporter periplasmic adaptor subunit [bacterium]
MKRVILYVLTALLIALIVYRFAERRKVEATLTIAQIQAEKGYPIEVGKSSIGHFRMVNHYTGTVVGGKQSDVVSSLSEHVSRVLVTEGQYVNKDQVICELSRDNPMASHAQLKLALENAEKELERIQKLFDEGAVSEQILDGMTLQRNLAAEALAASEKLLFIRAPFAGKITELSAEPGKLVTPGQSVAKVVSIENPRVKVQIPARDREKMKAGSICDLETNGISIKGKIRSISLSADPEGRTFTAWIDLSEKPDGFQFSPGLMVDVFVSVFEIEEAVLVSPDALIRKGEDWFVYTVEDEQAALRDVILGGQTRDAAWIKSGLNADVTVVVSGANLLFDGAPVRIISRNN